MDNDDESSIGRSFGGCLVIFGFIVLIMIGIAVIRNGLLWRERENDPWLPITAHVSAITIENWSLSNPESGMRFKTKMNYSYSIKDVSYEGQFFMDDIDGDREDSARRDVINFIGTKNYFTLDQKTFLPTDKSITVYYDVKDPAVSLPHEPTSKRYNNNFTLFIGVILVLLGVIPFLVMLFG